MSHELTTMYIANKYGVHKVMTFMENSILYHLQRYHDDAPYPYNTYHASPIADSFQVFQTHEEAKLYYQAARGFLRNG